MVKKNYFILFFLISLVLITGCKKKETKAVGHYVGGTDGIAISFIDGSPLTSFNEDESMLFKVRLTNKGEYSLKTGEAKARLFALTPGFGLSDIYIATNGPLNGISSLVNEGQSQDVSFGEGRYVNPIVNSQNFDFHAMVCYPYQTSVSAEVCMGSRRIGETRGEKVCEISGEKIGKGTVSSAPLQVTSVTETFAGSDKIQFKIVVENKGKGDVYNTKPSCEDIDKNRLENADVVEVEVVGPVDTECFFSGAGESNKGIINLVDGIRTLTCRSLVRDTGSNYKDTLNLKFSYKYIDRASRTVTVYEVT